MLNRKQPGYDAVISLKLPIKAGSLQVHPVGEVMEADTHKAAWKEAGDSGLDSGQGEKNKWETEREAELVPESKSDYYLSHSQPS